MRVFINGASGDFSRIAELFVYLKSKYKFIWRLHIGTLRKTLRSEVDLRLENFAHSHEIAYKFTALFSLFLW